MSLEVPQGWESARLGDVADIAFSGVDKKTVEGETPVLICNYMDVYRNRRIVPTAEFMKATATATEIRRWSLKKDDVLFTKDSETPTDIGVPSHVTEDMPDVLCGYHLGRARPNPRFLEGSFLAHALGSQAIAKELSRIANGITRFGLTLPGVRSLPLAVPPLPEQRAISAALESIDETIERTEAVIAATEQLRDSMRHELLTRGLPGWHTEWEEVSWLGTIPTKWEAARLGDLVTFSQGGTPSKRIANHWNGDIPFVTGADLTDFYITRQHARSFLSKVGLVSGETTVCEAGSVLLATRTRVGLAGIAKERMGASQDITRITPKANVQAKYLCRALLHTGARLQRLSRGTTIQGVTRHDTQSLLIPLPTMPEQEAIATVLDAIDETIDRAEAVFETLKGLKTSTAESLLTGRIRIAVASKDNHGQ